MSGPHDLFVRYTFGHPERAAAELRAVLPSHVVSEVDWESLRREPGSVVDPELRETESDLLFTARLRTGRPVLLYVLLEHQSSVDPWMALRMLRYVVRQVERWRQEHPQSPVLPLIIPLVMYHGPEGTWTAPRRVEDLFDLPDEGRERWRALVPRFEYLLDDLTAERHHSNTFHGSAPPPRSPEPSVPEGASRVAVRRGRAPPAAGLGRWRPGPAGSRRTALRQSRR